MSKIKKNNSENLVIITGKNSEILTKKCDRNIRLNKYERNIPEISNWWLNLFNDLESDAAILPYKQVNVLKQTFSKYSLDRLLSKISIQSRRFKGDYVESRKESFITAKGDKDETGTIKTDKRDTEISLMASAEWKETVRVSPPVKSWEKIFIRDVTPERNKYKMYSGFLNRKSDRAAIWRPLPALSLNEMNLNQKSDAITEKIATEFIDWLKSLGGNEDLPLDVQTVIDMFEIGFQAEAATSLKVDLKELASVPLKVTEAYGIPSMAKRAVLHNEIAADIKTAKRKKYFSSFGTHLPPDLQMPHLDENTYKKWTGCDNVHEDLASMATVWKGITHLNSTKAYCDFFLLQKPDIKPPKYLVDCGMFKTAKMRDDKSQSTMQS